MIDTGVNGVVAGQDTRCAVDIACPQIAAKAWEWMNQAFYELLLSALQSEAAVLGYEFVIGSGGAALPAHVVTALGRAVVRARRREIEPLMEVDLLEVALNGDDVFGYATRWAERLLETLAGQGFHLRPLSNAAMSTDEAQPPAAQRGALSRGAQRFEYYHDAESLERYAQRTAAAPLRELLARDRASWQDVHALLRKYGLLIEKGSLGGYVVRRDGSEVRVKASRVFIETFAGKVARAETKERLGEWVPPEAENNVG